MSETYVLAIDIGTSRVAAATARVTQQGRIDASSFSLGRRGDSVASVVFVSDDGDLSFGDVAERRGVGHPGRLVREFKRSIGDDVPLTVGGRSLPAEELYAQTFASIIDTVAEREGARPDAVSLTYPTVWGQHRLGLIGAALGRLGIADVMVITEPEAAARHYEASRPLEPGRTLAVYDLGGGTFDSVVLRKGQAAAFELVGDPVGIDDLGGADFDDAVLRHVIATSGLDVSSLSVDDADTRLALAQLRRESIDAKEALSFDSDATIPVLIAAGRSSIRLTRSEFEHMIEGSLDRTLDALARAIDSAGLRPDQLDAILLVGGSSRIPLVAQRLSERFDRPLAIDADPKAAISLGAARTALIRLNDRELAGVPTAFDAALAGTGADVRSARGGGAQGAPAPAHAAGKRGSTLLMTGAIALLAGTIAAGGTVAAGAWIADPLEDPRKSSNGPSSPPPSRVPGATPTPTASALTLAPVSAPRTSDELDASEVSTPIEQNPRRNRPIQPAPSPPVVSPRTLPPPSNITQPASPPVSSPAPAPSTPPVAPPPADPPPADPPPAEPPPADPPPTDPPPTDPPPADPPPEDPPPADPPPEDPPPAAPDPV